MGRRYVILRETSEKPVTRRGMPRAGTRSIAPPPPAAAPKVEVDELPARRAADLARTRGVVAVAPIVPMRLIAPVVRAAIGAQPAGEPVEDGVAWGIRAVAADTSPFDGEGIVVAVLDTGIDPAHPAFAGVEIERRNFTQAGDDDDNGHGTHCAGTIFGRDVDGVRIGIARGVRKALIGKVLGKGGGGSDQVADAIKWAVDGGANVISMSLGIDFPGYVKELEAEDVPTELATSMALEGYRANILLFERLAGFLAAQSMFRQPVVLVAAAGNESRRDENPDFEIAVSPPAVADGFISVAGVGKTPQGFVVASFSNVGARVSGPGVDILSAVPGGGLATKNGTSMATPHVAGVAALWAQKLEAGRQFSAKLLADRLVGTATTVGMMPGFDFGDIGAGLVQAP
jgi:subtilisin family serine protease